MENNLPISEYRCHYCGYHVSKYKDKVSLIKKMKVTKVRICESCKLYKLQKYFNYYVER